MAKVKKRKPDLRRIRPSKAYLLPEIGFSEFDDEIPF